VLSEIVREDRHMGRLVAQELINTGAIRCVLDAGMRAEEGSHLRLLVQKIHDDVGVRQLLPL